MRPLTSEKGFTYIVVMVIVVIMGIMLGAAGQSWKTIMQRDREEELMFRGTQIVRAIERWSASNAQTNSIPRPGSLDDLIKDKGAAGTHRNLRRAFKDPMTGKDFELIKDPLLGIKGVKSTSTAEPIKQANFPIEFLEFEGKKKYSEWEFVFIKGNKNRKRPKQGAGQGDIKGLNQNKHETPPPPPPS